MTSPEKSLLFLPLTIDDEKWNFAAHDWLKDFRLIAKHGHEKRLNIFADGLHGKDTDIFVKQLGKSDVVAFGLRRSLVVDDSVQIYFPIDVLCFFGLDLFGDGFGQLLRLHLFALASESLQMHLEKLLVLVLVSSLLHYQLYQKAPNKTKLKSVYLIS